MSSSMSYEGSGQDPQEMVDQLNSLLRGEISASETYEMAIKKLSDSPSVSMSHANELRELAADHEQAAQTLRSRIQDLGGQPADSSGAWGAWAQTVQGTSNLFGDRSALKALKEGEEHGLKDYQQALDDVDATSRQVIENQLLPAQERHIDLLDQLINSVGRA